MTLVKYHATLTQYLIEQRRHHPDATGDFNELILAISLAARRIAREVAHGPLAGIGEAVGKVNVQGEDQKALDVVANDIFIHTLEWTGVLAGFASEEMDDPLPVSEEYPRGKYLLVFDPLDGSSNLDVNVSVGSIFSVLRMDDSSTGQPTMADYLQPGERQVAAGYAIYGPSTQLVLTVGRGVVGFTLDPEINEFILTHPDIRVPESTCEFAINSSNSRFWEAPVKRYVAECLEGQPGVRGKDFNMRWIASLVAEAHRILTRGGVFLYPRDSKDLAKPGRLRLLYECNPIGMIIEQAGGRASTGEFGVLGVKPTSLHQRIGFVFGSAQEVERIERYHAETPDDESDDETPLFNTRGLFRLPA